MWCGSTNTKDLTTAGTIRNGGPQNIGAGTADQKLDSTQKEPSFAKEIRNYWLWPYPSIKTGREWSRTKQCIGQWN